MTGRLLLAAVALVAASCGGSAPTSASRSTGTPAPRSTGTPPLRSTGTVRWAPCAAAGGPSAAECATVALPGVRIALDRLPARGRRTGVLVVNPGGPGISAVDRLVDAATLLPDAVRSHFDVVGFDPPGVGHSDPVSCLDQAALGAYYSEDPEPPGPDGPAAVTAAAEAFAGACAASPSGPLLTHVATVDAAADLDAVRAALGEPTLSFLGFSYGTLLGATYAAAYPTHVRAMVLDGALDPTLAPLDALTTQGEAVDRQFAAFASACAASRCPWHPKGPPEAALGAIVERARAGALGAGVGPAQVLYGAVQGLYLTSSWPALASALAAATRGDGSKLLTMFDAYAGKTASGWSTEIEAETAVNCTDVTAPTVGQVDAAAAPLAAAGELFATLDVRSETTCAVWPAPAPAGGPHELHFAGAAPIVVVGSTGDPVTPYAWAQHLAAQLGDATLLTRVGEGHTAMPASACVRAAVATYLVDLRPPAAGSRCPSD